MTGPHHVTWTIERGDECARARFACDGEVGAPCRTWCCEQCHGEGPQPGHVPTDRGVCGEVRALEDGGGVFGGGEHHIISDVPVVVLWDKDGSCWWDYDHGAIGCCEPYPVPGRGA